MKFRFFILILLVPQWNAAIAQTRDLQLPSLGDSTSSIISLEKERELGGEWLREYYRQVRFNQDYVLQDYIEGLVADLAPHASMNADNLHILVIDNPTMNAFAVPGGIIGVNTGLLNYARSEGELVSVLAHELAHLSRRHFARSIGEQQNNSIATLAGILTGIVLASAVGSDAGLAVISATQAAALDAQLSYSRQNEQEADRLGMQIMTAAGYNPQDVTKMFERMLEATRYIGFAVPEYLRTHPLTESRITDTQLRADQYPPGLFIPNSYYQLMRARALIGQSENSFMAVRRFQAELEGGQLPPTSATYGLALSYQNSGQFEEGLQLAEQLVSQEPKNPAFQILKADLLTELGQFESALSIVEQNRLYQSMPHAFVMQRAKILERAGLYEQAAELLAKHSGDRPNDPAVWYELAEVRGLEGDILGVHLARAEYFSLIGAFNQAIEQLRYARSLASDDNIQTAIIDNKISQIAVLRERDPFLR